MHQPNDDFQDRIQRILNEYKREELADKYGAQFSLESNPNSPPEVEAQWLEHSELEPNSIICSTSWLNMASWWISCMK